MGKRIKILSHDANKKHFEKEINEYLKKGWKIKGDLIKGFDELVIMIEKKVD